MARLRKDQAESAAKPPGADVPAQASFFEQIAGSEPARRTVAANSPPAKPFNDKLGHRQRLRARFMAGDDTIPDYELLELILFHAIQRADTKPIAKRLIAQFKTFAEVVNASPERLAEVEGVGDRVIEEIKLIRAAAVRLVRGDIKQGEVLGSWTAVIDYCRAAQGFDTRELFRIIFLDKKNRIIADEVQGEGTVDHTPVYVREVVKRALELAATAIILVHNHPSGDPSPSRADIDMTKMIVEAAKPMGITVHDHIIVGRQGHVSFRAQRLM